MLSLLAEESFNIFHLGAKRRRKLGGIAAGVFRVFFKSRGLADQAVKARDGRRRHQAARLFQALAALAFLSRRIVAALIARTKVLSATEAEVKEELKLQHNATRDRRGLKDTLVTASRRRATNTY
jgi:hypothetical protein